MLGCGHCDPDEYCSFNGGHSQCEKCTICPAGFFLVSQCSVYTDRICQVGTAFQRMIIQQDNKKGQFTNVEVNSLS